MAFCKPAQQNENSPRSAPIILCAKVGNKLGGWLHSTMERVPVMHPAAPGLILGVPRNFSLAVAEIY